MNAQAANVIASTITSNSLLTKLSKMRSNAFGCDIHINVPKTLGGTVMHSFSVHKLILSMCSPVFKTMFYGTTAMMEARTNEVTITDVTVPVMSASLDFVYTDKLTKEVMDKHAKDLTMVAHKYQFDEMETVCIQYLINNMNLSNATQSLVLSQLLSNKELKENALAFIVMNSKQMLQQPDFMPRLSEGLWREVIEKLAERNPGPVPNTMKRGYPYSY